MSDAKSGIWKTCELRELLASDFPGAWGSDPGSKQANVSVLRSTNLDDEGHIDYSTGAKRYFASRDLERKRLSDGDILLEASGGGPGKPVGRVAIFKSPGDEIYASSNFFRTLRPRSVVDSGFLSWYLQWIYQQSSIWQFQQQTTGIINLKHKDYLRQSIRLPEVQEQRRIAEILNTADETIRSTERLIAKQKTLKTQLASDLFTGSKRFENTTTRRIPLIASNWRYGRLPGITAIPHDWRLIRLVEYAKLESGHTPSRDVPGYWGGEIPWLSLHEYSKLDQHVLDVTRYSVTMEGIKNSSARLLPPGTVAFSRTATVGKCVILGRSMAT